MEKKKVNKSIVYMITGIVVLVLAIAGSAYACYSASATGEIVGTAAGAGLELTIEKLSTSANGSLIPLDNTPPICLLRLLKDMEIVLILLMLVNHV